MGGTTVPKDWERIVSYYYEHYSATIERLFIENGYELKKVAGIPQESTDAEEAPVDVAEDTEITVLNTDSEQT